MSRGRPPALRGADVCALVDCKANPNEFRNLAGRPEAAAVGRELKAALQEWMILERDYLPLPVPPAKK